MIFERLIYLLRWIKAWFFLRKHGFWDVHVHPRDMEQAYKYTIARWMDLASKYGVKFGAFMPNTDPTITDEETLLRYINIAMKSSNFGVKFQIWLGLTDDSEQIKEVVRLYDEYPEYVIGLKMFAGTSVGNLGLPEEKQQRAVLKILADIYKGPIAFHCEDDGSMHLDEYDSTKPLETWNLARPEKVEQISIAQLIRLVRKTKFKGQVHICHISSHKSILLVNEAKRAGMDITCGATIHHIVFDVEQMQRKSLKERKDKKCNPPIRNRLTRGLILRDVAEGKVDIVESDFAPHSPEDKENGASGVNNYRYLPRMIIELWKTGVTDEQIIELINKNPRRIFSRIENA